MVVVQMSFKRMVETSRNRLPSPSVLGFDTSETDALQIQYNYVFCWASVARYVSKLMIE